jgi:curved DNA-binding protein CbpA
MRSPYADLGVAENASDAVIVARYREIARRLHPDVTGGDAQKSEQLKTVTAAYNRLKNPSERARVDAELRNERLRKVTKAGTTSHTTVEKPAPRRRRRKKAVAKSVQRSRPSAHRSSVMYPAVARRPAAAVPTQRVPMPFSHLAASIARSRPKSETPWWTVGGIVADILWASRRR